MADEPRARPLPESSLSAAIDRLWLGRGLEEPLKPLFTDRQLEARVFAPATISDEDLRNFNTGTPAIDSCSVWWSATLSHIVDIMRRRGALWLVPDSLGHPNDPFLNDFHSSADRIDSGDALYWLARQPDEKVVEAAWRSGYSAPGVMGVLSDADLPPGQATANELQEAAAQTTHVVISAYDHPDRPIVFRRVPEA